MATIGRTITGNRPSMSVIRTTVLVAGDLYPRRSSETAVIVGSISATR